MTSAAFDPLEANADERTKYLEVRMERAHDECKGNGRLVLGGEEVMLLWDSLASSFIASNWIGVVLSAQAMCERGLAGFCSLQDLPGVKDFGRTNWEKAGLGTLLKWAREDGGIPLDVLAKVQVVCDRRKMLTHWKRPLEPGTIMHRIADVLRTQQERANDLYEVREELLASDAMIAVDAVFEFCFGDPIRWQEERWGAGWADTTTATP